MKNKTKCFIQICCDLINSLLSSLLWKTGFETVSWKFFNVQLGKYKSLFLCMGMGPIPSLNLRGVRDGPAYTDIERQHTSTCNVSIN